MKTIVELKQRLQEQGSLSAVLKPKDFAPKGEVADILGQNDRIKATQLRRVFTTVRQLERGYRGVESTKELSQDTKNRLLMLGAELAYAVGRELLPRDFYEKALEPCLHSDKMQTVADLRRLGEFLAAVVAYHKFHNPRS